jgi:hypothetical protein
MCVRSWCTLCRRFRPLRSFGCVLVTRGEQLGLPGLGLVGWPVVGRGDVGELHPLLLVVVALGRLFCLQKLFIVAIKSCLLSFHRLTPSRLWSLGVNLLVMCLRS